VRETFRFAAACQNGSPSRSKKHRDAKDVTGALFKQSR
jgi:hypothetical protein